MGVDGGVRHLMNETERLNQTGHHRLADPAQSQTDDGDAELNAVDDFIEMLMQALHGARADAAGLDELLDSGIAHADQGELRGCEKRVRCHQEEDQEHAEQHEGDHLGVILMGHSSIGRRSKRLTTSWRLRLKFFNTGDTEEHRVNNLRARG